MTRTEIENSVEFIRLSKAIQTTMFSIAYKAYMRSSFDDNYNETNRYTSINNDVDTSFSAISYCFEDFDSLCDTMCRDYAKEEIHSVIRQYTMLNQQGQINASELYDFFLKEITAEAVLEDILDMQSTDETDEVS